MLEQNVERTWFWQEFVTSDRKHFVLSPGPWDPSASRTKAEKVPMAPVLRVGKELQEWQNQQQQLWQAQCLSRKATTLCNIFILHVGVYVIFSKHLEAELRTYTWAFMN